MARRPKKSAAAEQKTTLAERISAAQSPDVDELNLSGLGLTGLPAQLFELTHLRKLTLDRNRLTNVPAGLSKLTDLKTLELRDNPLEAIPAAVFQLSGLRDLDPSGTGITEIPTQSGNCLNYVILMPTVPPP
jgi:Leucine-rich repeat (LRR) protein